MKVLIAIDESDCSKAVLEAVAHRNWTPSTEILLLNVLSSPSESHPEDFGLHLPPDVRTRLLAKQKLLLADSLSYLREHLPAETNISIASAEGHAADQIITVAGDWGADMIMIGSHDYKGLEKFFLGSVAEPVLMNAQCSVEIVRAKENRAHKIHR